MNNEWLVHVDAGKQWCREHGLLDDELCHYGVKGMKWGVRKDRKYGSNSRSKSKSDTSGRDHSKSNKSPLAMFATNVVLDVTTLNPVGLAMDVATLVKAGESFVKSKIYDQERKLCETDPKTGFLLKRDNNTSIAHDAVRVNPEIHNFDKNTKNNCMLCTSAYDLRRRGYEVQAKKASYGYFTEELKAWYPKAKIETLRGVNDKGKSSTKAMISELTNALVKQGDGARGNLMVTWNKIYGGHSVAYEVSGGKVSIIDAQIGKIYTDKGVDRFLSKCRPTVEYARLDNVAFSKDNIKEVAE